MAGDQHDEVGDAAKWDSGVEKKAFADYGAEGAVGKCEGEEGGGVADVLDDVEKELRREMVEHSRQVLFLRGVIRQVSRGERVW